MNKEHLKELISSAEWDIDYHSRKLQDAQINLSLYSELLIRLEDE